MVFPFSGNHYVKFYWGTEEILTPVWTTTKEAVQKHPNVSVFINFASFRSVHETTMEAMSYPEIKTVAIIAEGVPEQQTRELIKTAQAPLPMSPSLAACPTSLTTWCAVPRTASTRALPSVVTATRGAASWTTS